ncbi:reverse transcriptase domain-containing protein, partial [Tanacetum coccineum]
MLSIILRCMSLAQLAMVVALETSTERSGFRVLLWFGYEVTGSDGGSRFGWRLGSGSVVGSEHPNQQRIIWKATWRSKIGGSRELQSCMSTRSTLNDLVSLLSNPESVIRHRQRNLGEPSLLVDFEEINMANNPNNVQGPPPAGPIHRGPPGLNLQNPAPDLRPMEELLQAPTDGVGDATVVPLVLASQFELKIGLLNLVTTISFCGFENDDPHSHIRRTTNLQNEITRFQQRFGESFTEAWDRFKDLLNKCPHHGFSFLHQIDTFYNGLNQSDQDSLNSAAGMNFLTRNTQEALTIIENKSKVRTSRNKPQDSSASVSSSQNDAITALTKQVEALV